MDYELRIISNGLLNSRTPELLNFFLYLPMEIFTDEYFMKRALKEAEMAFEIGEVPIGAIIVAENQIIARAHNLSQRLNDFTAHAEMQAYTSASNYLGSKYLNDCTLYVTLEPCVMCAGAAYWTRVGRIVFAAYDEKRGFTQLENAVIHPKTTVIGGVMEKEAQDLLSNFFQGKRES